MAKRRGEKQIDSLEVNFQPSGKTLDDFLNCTDRRQFILGPLGSGKTFTSAIKALKIICEQAPGPDGVRRTAGLVTRTNMTDLEASALKDWLELTEGKFKGALGTFHYASPAHHELRFKLPDGTSVESTLWFMGLDDPDGVQKVRGMPLTFAWLNETKDIPFALVTMIHSRTGRYPRMEDGGPTWYGTFGDTNMPHAGHWMFEFAENSHPKGWTFFRQPGGVLKIDGEWVLNKDAENLGNLPPDYYMDLIAGAADDWIKVYLGAEYGFALSGTPVFPEYVDGTHCREFNLVKGLPIWIGCDWGHTPAAIIGQRLPNGAWRWHSEIVTSDFGIIRFANELNKHLKLNYPDFKISAITGDPAGVAMEGGDVQERNIFDILASNGIVASPANTNDPTVRREAVAYFLNKMIDGQPGFLIHPQCKVARIGLAGGYKFKKIRGDLEGNVRAKPDKNMYSHCVEAGEYMMMGAGEDRTITRRERPEKRQMETETGYDMFA